MSIYYVIQKETLKKLADSVRSASGALNSKSINELIEILDNDIISKKNSLIPYFSRNDDFPYDLLSGEGPNGHGNKYLKSDAFADWWVYETSHNIEIPSNIKSIGSCAFMKSNIRTIAIPNSVIDIGMDAFSNCDYLTDIYYLGTQSEWDEVSKGNIPETISVHTSADPSNISYEIVNEEVVLDAYSILDPYFVGKVYIIPNTINGYPVTTINGLLISNSIKNETIIIPENITKIGSDIFAIASSEPQNYYVVRGNNNYKSENGILLTKDGTQMIKYPNGRTEKIDYTIPNSVALIWNRCFQYNQNCKSIKIPDSVHTIGNNAFSNSTIEEVELPNNITLYGEALRACDKLSKVIVGARIIEEGFDVFLNCNNISQLIIKSDIMSQNTPSSFDFLPTLRTNNGAIYIQSISENIDLDALVTQYKVDPNWSAYADIIKPITELPIEE